MQLGLHRVRDKKVPLYFLPQLCQIFTTHHDSLLTCALEVVLLIYLLLITLVTNLKRSAKKTTFWPSRTTASCSKDYRHRRDYNPAVVSRVQESDPEHQLCVYVFIAAFSVSLRL